MALVSLFRGVRRALRAGLAPATAVALVAQIARGGFGTPLGFVEAALVAAVALSLLVRLRARPAPSAAGVSGTPLDPSLGLVLLGSAYALVAHVDGASGPLGALPVVTLATCVALSQPRLGVLLIAYAVLGELALHLARHAPLDLRLLALRAGLLAVGGVLHHGLTRLEIARVRVRARQMIHDERQRQREAAQSFRLVSSASALSRRTERDDEARVRSSLDEIHASVVGLLVLVRRTMGLRTCALFWADSRGRFLRLVEAATDDTDVSEEPIPFGAGTVGAAASMARPIVLAHLRPDHPGLVYYRGPHGVKAFAALPILEGAAVRGVLVADRTEDRPFDEDEQATLESVALQARRLIDNERVFGRLERARNDLAHLFQSARALGEALTEDQVLAAVANSARAIVAHDLLVLTSYDEHTHEHRVRHAEGPLGGGALAGSVFADNAGLVSAAVKTRHALPYKGQYDPRMQYVFTRDLPLGECASVLTLPLVVRDRAMGTLTLASHRRSAFPEGTRQLLGVLAAHASVALANAAAVHRLEELATTDPMTGLLNKRSLEAEFEQRVRAATRFGKPLAVIMADIDKFKNVNDTYGHAVGDVVIKGLGAVLTRCRRETDIVARFGGEEFVVVCEETDTAGAFRLAERIREELGRQVFQTELGTLQVTCSLGIAEFPRGAADRAELLVRADEALYEAKHHGRNQTCVAPLRAAPAPRREPGHGAPRAAGQAG